MKRYVAITASDRQSNLRSQKLKESDLDQYKYGIHYTCNNSTYGDDFLLRANELGAIKVITTQINPKTNRPFQGKSIFYAVRNEEDYYELKDIAEELGNFVHLNKMFDIHWDMHVVVSVDDYELGTYLVKKSR